MKNNKILLITAFTVVLLSVSQFNPLVSTVGQSADQSTTFATGDHLEFGLFRNETRSDFRQSTSYNASNPSQVFNYQEEVYDELLFLDGNVSIDFLRQRDYTPLIDTVIIPKISAETLPGSQSSGYRNEMSMEFNNTNSWRNETFPVEDLSGRRFNDEGETEDISSNSTYALILSEMINSSVYVDFYGFPGVDTSNFSRMAPLMYRDVYNSPGWTYEVNGVVQTFNVRVVDSYFSTSFAETTMLYIPFGPENDPNTTWVDVQATWSIYYDQWSTIIFDQVTGAPLEITEGNNFDFDFSFANANITVWDPSGNYSQTFGIDSTFSVSAWSDQTLSLTRSSSLFGNTRPVSVGNGRLMEGDVLRYGVDSYDSLDTTFDVQMSGYNGSFSSFENQYYENSFEGTMILDVFRNNNNQFDAVIFIDGYSNSTNWFTIQEIENGLEVFYDSGNYFDGPYQSMFIDILRAGSTPDHEFNVGVDDSLRLPNFFDNNDCMDNSCQDDFVPPMPDRIPKLGPVNHTLLDFSLFDDGELPSLIINGFNYTWTELDFVGQEYFLNQSSIIEVPLGGPEEGPDRMWMNVSMVLTAWGSQENYYDPVTGVLLAHIESLYVELWIGGGATFWDDLTNTSIYVDLYVSLRTESEFSFFLESHPNLYQTAQTTTTTTTTTDPVPTTTTTTTDPVPTTTTTTTTDPVTSTSTPTNSTTEPVTNSTTTDETSTTEEDTAPGLPVPVPIAPVIAALVVISFTIKRRR